MRHVKQNVCPHLVVDVSPAWSTASGSLGEVYEDVTISTITTSATDTDGDTIVYSVQSGTLPTGLSLNSSTGTITGTPNVNDTYSFSFWHPILQCPKFNEFIENRYRVASGSIMQEDEVESVYEELEGE